MKKEKNSPRAVVLRNAVVEGWFYKAVSFAPSDDSLYNFMENTRKRRLSVKEAMRYWLQIREAVDHLHNLGIIHKDIKGKVWQHFDVQVHVGYLFIICKWLPWQGKKFCQLKYVALAWSLSGINQAISTSLTQIFSNLDGSHDYGFPRITMQGTSL